MLSKKATLADVGPFWSTWHSRSAAVSRSHYIDYKTLKKKIKELRPRRVTATEDEMAELIRDFAESLDYQVRLSATFIIAPFKHFGAFCILVAIFSASYLKDASAEQDSPQRVRASCMSRQHF